MPRPKRREDASAEEPVIVGWHDDPDCPQAIVEGRRAGGAAHDHWHSPYVGPTRVFVPRKQKPEPR